MNSSISQAWYCSCLGTYTNGEPHLHTVGLHSAPWKLSTLGIIDLSVIKLHCAGCAYLQGVGQVSTLWFLLFAALTGPHVRALGTRVLHKERAWLLQWFQVWTFVTVMESCDMNEMTNRIEYGSYALNECLFFYVSSWFALFVSDPCPSRCRNRAVAGTFN